MRKSRHGLTRCSACRAHVRAGETPSTTECPFCGANLREGRARVVVTAGRGGVLAASLLALSACGGGSSGEGAVDPEPVVTSDEDSEDSEDNQNTESTESTDNTEPDGEDQFEPPPSDEPTPVEAYGIAPDERPQIDEPRDQPLYGIPE